MFCERGDGGVALRPVDVGLVEWRSLSTWYAGDAPDSRDTSPDVQTVFLHLPDL